MDKEPTQEQLQEYQEQSFKRRLNRTVVFFCISFLVTQFVNKYIGIGIMVWGVTYILPELIDGAIYIISPKKVDISEND